MAASNFSSLKRRFYAGLGDVGALVFATFRSIGRREAVTIYTSSQSLKTTRGQDDAPGS